MYRRKSGGGDDGDGDGDGVGGCMYCTGGEAAAMVVPKETRQQW